MYDALVVEAKPMRFPMRLLWMPLDSYSRPKGNTGVWVLEQIASGSAGYNCGMYSCCYSAVYLGI
eukprot:8699020-Pyramimonas_sp.AAC.1